MKFISDVTFLSRPSKSVNPNFWQYQPDRNSNKFNCYFKIQPETVARISVCTQNALKLPSNQIHIDVYFMSLPGNFINPHFSKY